MLEVKNVEVADEKHTFEHGEVLVVNLTGMTVGRASFRPGWRWSTDVKPVVGTKSCQLAHSSYVVSGRLRVRMDDGTERELGPGDAHVVSPGHDAWVVGDEPCVVIDFASTGGLFAGRAVRCPCGVEFRVAGDEDLEHLVDAVREHASAAHGHEMSREEVLEAAGAGSRGQEPGAPGAAGVPGAPGAEAAIRELIEAYGDRLRAGDVDGIMSLYTADAVVMAPDLPTAAGSDQIAATYTPACEGCVMDYRFRFDTIDVRGDTAVARTRTTGTTTIRATGEGVPGTNRELFVLRRDGDGWRIAEYMFQPEPAQS